MFFHTEGAVTHVFQRVPPSWLPSENISLQTVCLDDRLFQTNSYIADAVQRARYPNCIFVPKELRPIVDCVGLD